MRRWIVWALSILIVGGLCAIILARVSDRLSSMGQSRDASQQLAGELGREHDIARTKLAIALADSAILRDELAEAQSRLEEGERRLRAVGAGLRSSLAVSEVIVAESGELVAGLERSIVLAQEITRIAREIESRVGAIP